MVRWTGRAWCWTDLGQHATESIRDTLVSYEAYVCFVLTFDVLRVRGIVDNRPRGTICEFRNAPSDKTIDVE